MKTRTYRQTRRAEQQAVTRRRIVEATVDLHREIGPAATTVTAIAARAGVQRHTVYRHFPDEASVFAACTAHFLAANPPPDPATWGSACEGLRQLYGYYEANRQMIASVLRDSEVRPVGTGFLALKAAAASALAPAGATRTRRAIATVAADFRAWQTLDLPVPEAADLMARVLDCA